MNKGVRGICCAKDQTEHLICKPEQYTQVFNSWQFAIRISVQGWKIIKLQALLASRVVVHHIAASGILYLYIDVTSLN